MGRAVTPATQLETERSRLRAEVAALIEPYRMAPDKPPFSAGELIIMAGVMQDSSVLRISRVKEWIVNTFLYWARLGAHAHLDGRRDDPGPFECVDLAFGSYDLPIEINHWWSNVYTICHKAARVYLRKHLEPARKGTFRFTDLAPELRNRIYQYSLVFDTPLEIASKPWDNRSLPSRYLRRYGTFFVRLQPTESPEMRSARSLPSPSVVPDASTTALLQVSKQVRGEASTIFFGSNSFNFDSARAISDFFACAPLQINNLRRVSINIDLRAKEQNHRMLQTVLEKLGKSPSLDVLTFCEHRCPKYCNSPTGGSSYPACEPTGLHDGFYARQEQKFPAVIKAMLTVARRAKKIKFFRNYVSSECTWLERFLLGRLRQERTVNLLCCHIIERPDKDGCFR